MEMRRRDVRVRTCVFVGRQSSQELARLNALTALEQRDILRVQVSMDGSRRCRMPARIENWRIDDNVHQPHTSPGGSVPAEFADQLDLGPNVA